MSLKNTNLTKVGSTYNTPNASGHSQACIVVPATALPNPGGNDGTPSWPQRYQQYIQSITPTIKYSQDSE